MQKQLKAEYDEIDNIPDLVRWINGKDISTAKSLWKELSAMEKMFCRMRVEISGCSSLKKETAK